jgi:NAD(P)-dependent dehydrogenase (short-subunit alcohol dehydrogenase family)
VRLKGCLRKGLTIMDEMKGKVALVTGASSGIGKATAVKFAEAGVKVAAVARRIEMLESLSAGASGEMLPIAADITLPHEVDRVIAKTVEAFGGIDILVSAAGILRNGTVETTSLDDWDDLMNLNARAPFYLMKKAMPYLIERKGSVVNVSSVNGLRAFPGVLAYCVSKAAVDHLTRCAALEVASKGVRVNSVNPGVTLTNLHLSSGMDEEGYKAFLERSKSTHPLGRVGTPEEVADLIFFLSSPKAGWITGANYSIDGGRGQTCLR